MNAQGLYPWRSLKLLRLPILTKAIIAATLALSTTSSVGWAVPFRPQGTVPRPGSRHAAATRGGGPHCSLDKTHRLTTLVPHSRNGWTTSESPTFYWSVPKNTYEDARFDLYEGEGDSQRQVYSKEFSIKGNAGVASSIYLSDPLPPLSIGREYRWVLVLVCPDSPSRNVFAEGWIQRMALAPKVSKQLAQARPEDRLKFYAEAGIWYDAVHELAQLRQAQPQDRRLIEEWNELMNSEAVQLSEAVDQPLTAP